MDYFTFVKGKDATDPEPIVGDDDPGTISIANVKFDAGKLQDYYVFDMQVNPPNNGFRGECTGTCFFLFTVSWIYCP